MFEIFSLSNSANTHRPETTELEWKDHNLNSAPHTYIFIILKGRGKRVNRRTQSSTAQF